MGNLINDSLRTTVSLRFSPKSIAVSAIYLASKMSKPKIEIDTNKLLDLVKEERPAGQPVLQPQQCVDIVDEVGNEILDLYEYDKKLPDKAGAAKPGSSPPPPPRASSKAAPPPPKPPAPPPPPSAAPPRAAPPSAPPIAVLQPNAVPAKPAVPQSKPPAPPPPPTNFTGTKRPNNDAVAEPPPKHPK